MFSLGFSEWVMIMVVVLIFVKPQDYPLIFRNIGRFFRKCDTIWKNIVNQFDIYKDS